MLERQLFMCIGRSAVAPVVNRRVVHGQMGQYLMQHFPLLLLFIQNKRHEPIRTIYYLYICTTNLFSIYSLLLLCRAQCSIWTGKTTLRCVILRRLLLHHFLFNFAMHNNNNSSNHIQWLIIACVQPADLVHRLQACALVRIWVHGDLAITMTMTWRTTLIRRWVERLTESCDDIGRQHGRQQ